MKVSPRAVSLPHALVLSAVLAAGSFLFAGQPGLAYLSEGKPDAAALLAPPPMPGSSEQAADMAEVVAVFHACSSNEAALAFSEKKFSAFNFTSAVGRQFQPGKFPTTEAFLKRVQE